ncbi:MAG TPA: TlpA disulfide reductase family protein [Hanamia sp.]
MKIIFLAIFLLATYFTRAQLKIINKQFHFSGKIIGQKNGTVSLSYINNEGKQVKDSCFLQNGNFYFKGEIIEPTLAVLRGAIKSLADDDPNSAGFYLEPGNITAIVEKNHFNKIRIRGSKTQREFEMLQKKYEVIDNTNTADSAYEKIAKINYEFITIHPDSYISAFQLALYKTRWSIDSVCMLYDKLNPKIQESFYGKDVAETINAIKNNTPGKMAKPFTSIDINGESVSLSNFRGRYVLLDFWASWCAPCRQGNPHLIELFKKYHDKGFNILGVSEDYNTGAWKTAIRKDGIDIWHNMLGLKKDRNGKIDDKKGIDKIYGVQTLPTKILIDPNGIIIGRYGGTGGEDESNLDIRLKEIFQ